MKRRGAGTKLAKKAKPLGPPSRKTGLLATTSPDGPGRRRVKTGRPLAKIDEARVAELAFCGLSNRNIAVLVGVDDKTIANRFSALLAKKKAERHLAIHKRQWEILNGAAGPHGATTMAIWLGKNELGQTDKAAVEHSGDPPVQFNVLVAGQGSEAKVIDVQPTEKLLESSGKPPEGPQGDEPTPPKQPLRLRRPEAPGSGPPEPHDENASGRIAAAKPPDAHRPESTERGQAQRPAAPITVRFHTGRQAGAPPAQAGALPAGELEQDRQDDEGDDADDEDERADADPAPHGVRCRLAVRGRGIETEYDAGQPAALQA